MTRSASEGATAETTSTPVRLAGEAARWVRARWRGGRRTHELEPLAAPTAPLEDRPARAHVRRIEPPPPPREWNLWELERRAREVEPGRARGEEWTALFVNLREFADADGVLPKEFDPLVRESFADLIRAA